MYRIKRQRRAQRVASQATHSTLRFNTSQHLQESSGEEKTCLSVTVIVVHGAPNSHLKANTSPGPTCVMMYILRAKGGMSAKEWPRLKATKEPRSG